MDPDLESGSLLQSLGFAELDCVFTTQSQTDGNRTWICTRYQPSSVIEYASF